MSFLEKLLDGVAVEWKPLEEVATKISSGGTPKTGIAEYYDGDIPWLRTQELGFGEIWDTGVKITAAGLKSSSANLIPENCVIVAMYGATVGKIGINKIPMATNQACANIKLNESVANYRYIFHFLLSQYEYIKSLGAGSQTNINAGIVKKLQVPIPSPDNPAKSLKIQREIVRILDNFTELTAELAAELTAELTARKKQYNHYRDLLLSFEDGKMKWKTLGEVVNTIKTGKLNANAMVEDGAYPFFTCDAKPFKIDTYAFDTEAIIVSGNGSQIGHINYYKGKFNAYQRTYVLSDCSNVISMQFLLTYLKAYLRVYIMQHSKKGSVPYITMPMLENFPIPIPSPEEQAHIVAILDKFSVLTNSINEGLPREIELRQKQYEHYRDLLLSFANPEAIEA